MGEFEDMGPLSEPLIRGKMRKKKEKRGEGRMGFYFLMVSIYLTWIFMINLHITSMFYAFELYVKFLFKLHSKCP